MLLFPSLPGCISHAEGDGLASELGGLDFKRLIHFGLAMAVLLAIRSTMPWLNAAWDPPVGWGKILDNAARWRPATFIFSGWHGFS